MSKIIWAIEICLTLISPTGDGTFIATSWAILDGGTYLKYLATIEAERIAAEKAEQERIAAEKSEQERIAAEEANRILHTYANFERYDVEGYSIINVPSTHFVINEVK